MFSISGWFLIARFLTGRSQSTGHAGKTSVVTFEFGQPTVCPCQHWNNKQVTNYTIPPTLSLPPPPLILLLLLLCNSSGLAGTKRWTNTLNWPIKLMTFQTVEHVERTLNPAMSNPLIIKTIPISALWLLLARVAYSRELANHISVNGCGHFNVFYMRYIMDYRSYSHTKSQRK